MKKDLLYNIAASALAVIIAIVLGCILIYVIGKNPFEVLSILFTNTFSNSYAIGQIFFKATPLIFTGLSVAFAFRSGLFNIGAEGQLNIGGIALACIGFSFVNLPSIILIPLCLIAGFIAGGLWASIAGYLKARFGSHEVINTIMLNFIALALVSYLVNKVFKVSATIHTPEVSSNAYLSRFDSLSGIFNGSPFNLSFLIALSCCLVMYVIFEKTILGYELKTLGLNLNAAKYARMNVKKLFITSMFISGGFAGLAGSNFVMGYKHYYELGFAEGTGYLGIAVALMSRNNPIAIIFVALFFAMLDYGGLSVNSIVPKEIITIIQSLIIILVIIFSKVSEKMNLKNA